jgi:hypothetical protein
MKTAVENNDLLNLMGNTVKLVTDVAKNNIDTNEQTSSEFLDKLKTIEDNLTELSDGMDEIKSKELPKREQYPIEDNQKEQIYLQCLNILDKQLQDTFTSVFPEYNYVRFTVLDKDDYGNIIGGELIINTQMFLGEYIYDFVTTFDIVKGYILEPMYIEYKGQKITMMDLRQIFEESTDYAMEYIDQREKRTFLESPLTEGHTVREDRPEQKNYALYNFSEHGNTKVPIQLNKYFKFQQQPIQRNQGLIGS